MKIVVGDGSTHTLRRATRAGFRGEGEPVADSARDLPELVIGVVAVAGPSEIDVVEVDLANVGLPGEGRRPHEAIASWGLARTVAAGDDTLALIALRHLDLTADGSGWCSSAERSRRERCGISNLRAP